MSTNGAEIRAVLVAADPSGLYALTLQRSGDNRDAVLRLPSTAFDPGRGQSLQQCLRDWASIHTTAKIGHVAQLGVHARDGRISIGLLALVRDRQAFMPRGVSWTALKEVFPWEDRLAGEPDALAHVLRPALATWADAAPGDRSAGRHARIAQLFGADNRTWQARLCDARFALLYEAALVAEALRDGASAAVGVRPRHAEIYGRIMHGDDRHILCGALALLRKELACAPVMAALMDAPFTLGHLQKTVQAVTGQPLHTANFRRDLTRSGQIRALGKKGRIGASRRAALWQWCETGVSGPGMPLPLKKP